MAHFRGTVKGSRGVSSRLGSKKSGLVVTADGWDVGIRVEVWHGGGKDHVRVYRTGGSNERTPPVIIAEFAEEE